MGGNKEEEHGLQRQIHSERSHCSQWPVLQMKTAAFTTEETKGQHSHHRCHWVFAPRYSCLLTPATWVPPHSPVPPTPAKAQDPLWLHEYETPAQSPPADLAAVCALWANPSSCVPVHCLSDLHCHVCTCDQVLQPWKCMLIPKASTAACGPGSGPVFCHWPAPLGSSAASHSCMPLAQPPSLERLRSHRRVCWQPGPPQLLVGLDLALSPITGLYHCAHLQLAAPAIYHMLPAWLLMPGSTAVHQRLEPAATVVHTDSQHPHSFPCTAVGLSPYCLPCLPPVCVCVCNWPLPLPSYLQLAS